MSTPDPLLAIRVTHPDWVAAHVDWERRYEDDIERMRLAVALARENVIRETGGPFGSAVFERESGRLVAIGMNSVVRLRNSMLHAEVIALMTAEARVGSYSLRGNGLPAHELVTSCEPCAMCLGATLWSGVRRLVWGAAREDAGRLHFDEGPVFPESYSYLTSRGIEIVANVCRDEANAVLELYRGRGGTIYNA